MTREVAPGPFRSFWIRILPFLEPNPPATQSSCASRSTRAWCVAKCHVSRERFWIETYSNLAACPTNTSATAFVYAESSGLDDAYSSIRVKLEPSSATTSRRQCSDPPGTELAIRT